MRPRLQTRREFSGAAATPIGQLAGLHFIVQRALEASTTALIGFDTKNPHVLGFPLQMQLMSAADFPFPLLGLVHVANRIRRHRPVGAEETLDLTVRAADLRPHGRGQQVDLVTEVEGRAVVDADSLIVAVRDHAPGATVEVTYVRDGRSSTTLATLASTD